jgi:hypothetical protein
MHRATFNLLAARDTTTRYEIPSAAVSRSWLSDLRISNRFLRIKRVGQYSGQLFASISSRIARRRSIPARTLSTSSGVAGTDIVGLSDSSSSTSVNSSSGCTRRILAENNSVLLAAAELSSSRSSRREM